MKRIAILGSTGSIGKSALEVIKEHPDEFKAAALSTNTNIDILYQQIRVFKPALACVTDVKAGLNLKSRLKDNRVRILLGREGLEALAGDKDIDQVLLAISGAAALKPLLKAVENGRAIALANKEALVMAGPIIMSKAKNKKARIIPVDSEQSAIWQCLQGQPKNRIRDIYLTASGGPFRRTAARDLAGVSVRKVLAHPRWKMGRKITVDSATMMNKGLEVLEAMYLFGVSPEKIKIVIHPEAIIHSMVEFIDGVIMAQLSVTDMRVPIQYAFSWPERLANGLMSLNFYKIRSLNFERPDFKRFPCLGLAYRAAAELGTSPCVINASNEVSVNEFLKGRLKFNAIPRVIEKVLNRHRRIKEPGLDDIFQADAWARYQAHKIINKN
jgi:1-deoxy-D-xylulose-5-phosphate reductoisomerase